MNKKNPPKVGDRFEMVSGDFAEVISYGSTNETYVKFDSTGTVVKCSASNLRKGKVKDPYRRSVYGIGFYGEGVFKSARTSAEYLYWVNMLKRCYSGHDPSYADAQVSDEFHNYQFFASWCQIQVGFGNKGWHLDKDILANGSKIYHPSTCVFVPPEVNYFLVKDNYFGEKYTHRKWNYYKEKKIARAKDLAERFKNELDERVLNALINFEPKTKA